MSLVNEQTEKRETKQAFRINNYLINKHNHVNYRLANEVEKHKTISSEKQAHYEVLCVQTVEVQRQIEVAKNEIAQIMDQNEKKLEVIQKQQDLVQSMKEDNDEVQDNTQLDYHTFLKNKVTLPPLLLEGTPPVAAQEQLLGQTARHRHLEVH